jgi:hypothetical protein
MQDGRWSVQHLEPPGIGSWGAVCRVVEFDPGRACAARFVFPENFNLFSGIRVYYFFRRV